MPTLHPYTAAAVENLLTDEETRLDFEPLEQLLCEWHAAAEPDRQAA